MKKVLWFLGLAVVCWVLWQGYEWVVSPSPGEVEASDEPDYSIYSVGFANTLIAIDREFGGHYSHLGQEDIDLLLEDVETVEDAAKAYQVARRAIYDDRYRDLARHLWVEECREVVLASNSDLGAITSWIEDECPEDSELDLATDVAELAGSCGDWSLVVEFTDCN